MGAFETLLHEALKLLRLACIKLGKRDFVKSLTFETFQNDGCHEKLISKWNHEPLWFLLILGRVYYEC